MENLTLYVSAFLIAGMIIGLFRNHAAKVGLVDYPCERKRHRGEVPLIGGIAIFAAFFISLLISPLDIAHYVPLLVGGGALVMVGALDDIKALSSRIRFSVQTAAAVVMCGWGEVVLNDLGMLSFDNTMFTLGSLAVPFTLFATAGVINAVNMSDGIDGLCGSLMLVAMIGLAIATYVANAAEPHTVVMLLMSAVCAFLLFNIRFPRRMRALVFLGDAGTMFIGFTLAWFVVSLSQGEDRVIHPVTALWLLAMPLFDTIGIMIRRLMKGRSPFSADREHFHHAFQLAGFSVLQTHLTITAIAALFMGIGLAGQFAGVPEIVMFLLFLGLFAVYFWGMMRAWKFMRFLRRTMHNEKEPDAVPHNIDDISIIDGNVRNLRAYYVKQARQQFSYPPAIDSPSADIKDVKVVASKDVDTAASKSKSVP